MDWTLKQELLDRGLTLRDAAKMCDMDQPTMKALDGKRWPKQQKDGVGLAVPAPIDVNPEWWKKVKA